MAKKRKFGKKGQEPDIGETQDMELDDLEQMDAAADDATAGLPGTDDFEPIDEVEEAKEGTLEMENIPQSEEEGDKAGKKKFQVPAKSKTRKIKKTGMFGKKKDKKKEDEEEKPEEGAEEEEKAALKPKTVKIDRKKIKVSPVVAPSGGPRPIPVICIECYEEFEVDPGKEAKVVHCPECDHPAKMPNEEIREKWAIYKKAETKKLIGALGSFAFMVLLGVVWILLLANPENVDKQAINYVFPSFIFISFAVGIFFSITYERSRNEAYF